MKSLRNFFISRFGFGRDRTRSEGGDATPVVNGGNGKVSRTSTPPMIQNHGDEEYDEAKGILDLSETVMSRRIGILEVLVDANLVTDVEAKLILHNPRRSSIKKKYSRLG